MESSMWGAYYTVLKGPAPVGGKGWSGTDKQSWRCSLNRGLSRVHGWLWHFRVTRCWGRHSTAMPSVKGGRCPGVTSSKSGPIGDPSWCALPVTLPRAGGMNILVLREIGAAHTFHYSTRLPWTQIPLAIPQIPYYPALQMRNQSYRVSVTWLHSQ
jgi:hypothetical protein